MFNMAISVFLSHGQICIGFKTRQISHRTSKNIGGTLRINLKCLETSRITPCFQILFCLMPISVLTAGQLASCQMRFIQYDEATEINLATFECKEPVTEILYTSANDADYLDLDYTVTFEGPITPAYPPYIRKLDIGLIESGHQISLTGKGELIYNERLIYCNWKKLCELDIPKI